MMLKSTTAIILAGGSGSRLGELTKTVPKPLLNVAGRPFIFHLLDYLGEQGIKKVILSIGYLGNQFQELLGKSYKEISLDYSIEDSPLGTGGAICKALSKVEEENFFAFNGDTLFRIDLKELGKVHQRQKASLSLALRYVEDSARYGKIDFNNEIVTAFQEKGTAGSDYINGGIYLVQKQQWPIFKKESYSLESEVLPLLVQNSTVGCMTSNSYFIDIGIPQDFTRSQVEFKPST